MSLNTVLKIGKALRETEDNLKYFKYVEACPKDKDGNHPFCLTIPVKADYSFDWDNVKPTPENERQKLYYLKFKTSDSDGLVKYVFGDIYFAKNAKINKDGSIENGEGGFYRLENLNHSNRAFRPSSFNRGKNDYKEIVNSIDESENYITKKFHESLENEYHLVENILSYIPAVEAFYSNSLSNYSFSKLLKDKTELKELALKNIFEKAGIANLKKLKIEVPYSELSLEQKGILFSFMNASIFIHFDFSESKHWYQFQNDVNLINNKILSDFVDSTNHGMVLKKTLYKTLCSGDKKNDIQFPHFNPDNKYKSKAFENEDVQNLFYAIDYTNKGKLISNTNIKMIVLPLGENLKAQDYQDFVEKRDEARIIAKNNLKADSNDEPLFDFANDSDENITSFDLIFCKKGGLTSPDTDLIELSGIEKSKLKLTKERVNSIASDIYEERKKIFKTQKDLSPLSIEFSFKSILGNPQLDSKTGKVSIKANPKYESHLLKALPLIYTDNYHQDDVLLPAFIQNVEYSIRSDDGKYSFLKFDLKFLFKIQNNKTDKFMEIQNSESYQIGVKLGRLSKPLKKAINSFEKNYVGLLTRRVATKDDCMKFYNEINEKLIMHNKNWGQSSAEIASEIVTLPIAKYDKEKFAFGFFEGYFKYEATDKKKDFFNRLEKLLADYEGNETLKDEVEQLTNLFQAFKN